MKSNLLVLCGPTGVGKTNLALYLGKVAHLLHIPSVEIISADSRQIYKGMDIGTGKGLPKESVLTNEGAYIIDGIALWGYDIANPSNDFSVAHYQKFAREKISEIWDRGHLPILVGGTGFYIKAVVDGIDTISVPKNDKLREELIGKSPQELFDLLIKLNPKKAKALNTSDQQNPARLVRAIEVSQNEDTITKDTSLKANILYIGIKHDPKLVPQVISLGIKKRLEEGFEEEIKKLLNNGVSANTQAMQSLGYKQWLEYLNKNITREQAINDWTREEIKYVKRQMTWFNKDSRIHWFDSFDATMLKRVEELVEKWHNTG